MMIFGVCFVLYLLLQLFSFSSGSSTFSSGEDCKRLPCMIKYDGVKTFSSSLSYVASRVKVPSISTKTVSNSSNVSFALPKTFLKQALTNSTMRLKTPPHQEARSRLKRHSVLVPVVNSAVAIFIY